MSTFVVAFIAMIAAVIAAAGIVALVVLRVRAAESLYVPVSNQTDNQDSQQALSGLLEQFRREADKLTARYAQEFALVRFLEESERAGDLIDPAKFQQDALKRASLLRIKQIEDAITSHLAAKSSLAKSMEAAIRSNARAGGFGARIAELKKQIEIEEKYVFELNSQLRELRLSR